MTARFIQPILLTEILAALIIAIPVTGLPGQQLGQTDKPRLQDISAIAQPTGGASKIATQQNDETKKSPQDDEPAKGLTYSNPVRTKWKVTANIVGSSAPTQNMFISIPVPNTWPEQSVAPVVEDIPPEIGNVKYRELNSRVKQLIVSIPTIEARQKIQISMTFLVSTNQVNPPEDPTVFLRPKTNHRAGKPYLGVGPQLNFKDSKLRKEVKSITANKDNLWAEVEAIFDWVRENIEDDNQKPRDLISVYRKKTGCNEDKVRMFVGMCRAHKIPARMVWVEGTQYAEFMLVDSQANPHWFPCTVGGVREFGSISEPRVVLQKGDSIRVPEKEGRQKFVAEFAMCRGRAKPSVKFSRQLLPAE